MKKNCYSATATASRITKIQAEVIRGGFRKGAKPTGNVLNAVIVARQLPSAKLPLLPSRPPKVVKRLFLLPGFFFPSAPKQVINLLYSRNPNTSVFQFKMMIDFFSSSGYNHFRAKEKWNKEDTIMNIDESILSKLTDEQKKKAQSAQSPEEILAIAKEAGYELSAEQLEAIAGGKWEPCWENCITHARCPYYEI